MDKVLQLFGTDVRAYYTLVDEKEWYGYDAGLLSYPDWLARGRSGSLGAGQVGPGAGHFWVRLVSQVGKFL